MWKLSILAGFSALANRKIEEENVFCSFKKIPDKSEHFFKKRGES